MRTWQTQRKWIAFNSFNAFLHSPFPSSLGMWTKASSSEHHPLLLFSKCEGQWKTILDIDLVLGGRHSINYLPTLFRCGKCWSFQNVCFLLHYQNTHTHKQHLLDFDVWFSMRVRFPVLNGKSRLFAKLSKTFNTNVVLCPIISVFIGCWSDRSILLLLFFFRFIDLRDDPFSYSATYYCFMFWY